MTKDRWVVKNDQISLIDDNIEIWNCDIGYICKKLNQYEQENTELKKKLENAIVPKFNKGDYFIEHWGRDINIYQYMGNKHFKCLNKTQGYHCDYVVLGALLLGEDFIEQIDKEKALQRLKELKGE